MPLSSLPVKVRIVVDYFSGKGPLGGVYTGLKEAMTFYSIIVACDMPFINLTLLNYLIKVAPGFDLVIPKIGGMLEPLHAVYSKNCLQVMEETLNEGCLQIAKIIPLVETRYITDEEVDAYDPKHLSFFNINTEVDLQKAKFLMVEQNRANGNIADGVNR